MVDLLCDQYHYDFVNLIAASDGDAAGSHLKDCIARRLFRAQSIAELKLVHELMSNEARR